MLLVDKLHVPALVYGLELGFGGAAQGALPAVRELLEGRPGRVTVVGVTHGGVVDVAANLTLILLGHGEAMGATEYKPIQGQHKR